jgi:hypothetical protein
MFTVLRIALAILTAVAVLIVSRKAREDAPDRSTWIGAAALVAFLVVIILWFTS